MFAFVLLFGLALFPLIYKVLTFKRAKVWSKTMMVVISLLVLLSFALLLMSYIKPDL
jgi:hypothetical protein